MTQLHDCLKSVPEVSKESLSRKERNNNYIKSQGIVCNDNLECLYNENITIKSKEDICKRAIASLLTIQISCDINNGKYEESKNFFIPMINKFEVKEYLNSKEKRILEGNYTQQDVFDMDWEYECYWALCWYLGLVDDIKDASVVCDGSKAVSFLASCKSFNDFVNKCNVRSNDELLDMEDLYYRYHWAVNDKSANESVSIGNLNSEIVIERRRALEWILSDKEDWYEIELNA